MNRLQPLLFYSLVFLGIAVYFTLGLFAAPLPQGSDALTWSVTQHFNANNSWTMTAWIGVSWPGGPSQISIVDLILTLLLSLFANSAISQLMVVFLFYLTGLGMYLYASRVIGLGIGAFIPSVLYMTGRPILDQLLLGHYTILLGIALLPFLFLLTDYAFRVRKTSAAIALGYLLGFFVSSVDPIYLLISVPLLLSYVVVVVSRKTITSVASMSASRLKLAVIAFVVAAFVSGVTTLPALLSPPAYLTSFTNVSFLIQSAFTTSSRSVFGALVTLDLEGPTFPALGATLFLATLPVMSYLAVIIRRGALSVYFGLVAFVVTALSLGPNPPFSPVYFFLANALPFFVNMRDPVLWSLLTIFAYSILSGIFLHSVGGLARRLLRRPDHLTPSMLLGVLIALVLISSSASSGIAYSHGLQSFTVPPDLQGAFKFLSQQPGDFAILSSPFGYNRIENYPTSDPWDSSWDFSLYSPVITNKPYWAIAYVDSSSSVFLQYLWHIIRSEQTQDFPKIIGSFGVKYIVLEGNPQSITPSGWFYTVPQERAFFINQNAMSLVYSQGNVSVLSVSDFVPPVSVAPSYALIIGGLSTYETFASLDKYSFAGMPFIFADQNLRALKTLVQGSGALIFDGTTPNDLGMLDLKSNGIGQFFSLSDFLSTSVPKDSWYATDSPYVQGAFRFATNAASTSRNSSISIPLTLANPGTYQILLHTFVGTMSEVAIQIDGGNAGIIPSSQLFRPSIFGFQWINVGNQTLGAGRHTLSLSVTLGTDSSLTIDEGAVVPETSYQQEHNNLLQLLSQSKGLPIYVVPTGSYLYEPASSWRLRVFTYNFSGAPLDTSTRSVLVHKESGFSGWLQNSLDIVKAQPYSVMIHGNGSFIIQINGENVTLSPASPNGLTWAKSPPVYLQPNSYTMLVGSNGNASFDSVMLYPTQLGLSNETNPRYQRASPTDYAIEDYSGNGEIVTLASEYNSLWHGSQGESTLEHVVASYILNGFLVSPSSGEPIELRYVGQDYVTFGLILTLIGAITPILILGYARHARLSKWLRHVTWHVPHFSKVVNLLRFCTRAPRQVNSEPDFDEKSDGMPNAH